MMLNAHNGTVKIGTADMDYISFGKGSRNLVMLPGLGDGLLTVRGTALAFAAAYKTFAKNYKVYVFSRKNQLITGYTTREMAKDQAIAMKQLGITNADIIGISQGGMIAQYVAIDYPELVHKLVLTVTLSRQNEMIDSVVHRWIEMAMSDNYRDLIIDTAERSYSEKYLKKHRFLYPVLTRLGKPKDFSRFLIQAHSCLQHNAYSELCKITCPVFIIGGAADRIVGVDASVEISQKIHSSELFIYKELGHAAYEEAKDFKDLVLDFLGR